MPPFADLLQQLVGADLRTGAFQGAMVECCGRGRVVIHPELCVNPLLVEQAIGFVVDFQQGLHMTPETEVSTTGLIEIFFSLAGLGRFDRYQEDLSGRF